MVGLLFDTGQSIPPNTPYAVSVSLPTWEANVGYEEGEDWVLSKMRSGYPRFYIDDSIRRFTKAIVERYGSEGEQALLFPSHRLASECMKFIQRQDQSTSSNRTWVLDLQLPTGDGSASSPSPTLTVSMALFPQAQLQLAKTFWQHTGEGISSRRADYCHRLFQEQWSKEVESKGSPTPPRSFRGPKRYRREPSSNVTRSASSSLPVEDGSGGQDCSAYIEERYGRNLDLALAAEAKLAIRRRIAGLLTANVELPEAIETSDNSQTTRLQGPFTEDDVYLFPTGMSSIFNIHRLLLSARGSLKSVCYGFPYIDTLKILQKWGPGCLLYGHGSSDELDDLQRRLEGGKNYLALFCEFPSNPLLQSPNLARIRHLADRFDLPVVVDETIGNFLNVHVLSYADVVVSSLTKIFSGDSNVMGGSAVFNPNSTSYTVIKHAANRIYDDHYWAEDAIVMERNSRDFASRIQRINENAEAICEVLMAHPRVKEVYYPKSSPTRPFYDRCRNPTGGYGGLLSVTFLSSPEAVTFFDQLETAKGPSLGTNFTLSCPYTLLAHYGELEWAASFGVESDLIRVSVGLETTEDLIATFKRALTAVTDLSRSLAL